MRDVGQAQAASGEIDVGRRLASVIVEFGFDDEGRMTSRTLPLGQRESMEFDANGNLVRKVTFNGEVLEYGYDDSDRMVLKRVPGHADVLITYTPSGQRAAVVDERGVTRYAYDARDRTVRVGHPEGTWIEYGWDAAGNRTRVETPNGWTSYEYDEAGRLTRAIDSAAGAFEYAFDLAGNQTRLDNPNGIVETRSYDATNRLLSIDTTGPLGVVFSAAYTLDATGRRIAVAENGGRVVQWTSDRLHRLVREEITDPVAGDEDIRFAYDAVGNRLSRKDLAHGLVHSTYDANDRLLTVGAETRSYDDAGNTLTAGGTAYAWDAEGRMLSANTAAGLVGFGYDLDGIRVRKTVGGVARTYLNDHEVPYAEVLEELAAGSFEARYAQARDLLARQGPEGVRVYHPDGITSLRALTDESGAKSDELRYEAFGTPTVELGDSPSRYRFAGEVRDEETGLQYHRARYYESETGRFFGMDPVLGRPGDTFGYGANAPGFYMDPSGETIVEAVVLGAVLGTLVAANYLPGHLVRWSHRLPSIFVDFDQFYIPGEPLAFLRRKVFDSVEARFSPLGVKVSRAPMAGQGHVLRFRRDLDDLDLMPLELLLNLRGYAREGWPEHILGYTEGANAEVFIGPHLRAVDRLTYGASARAGVIATFLSNTSIHELGHSFGLGHSNDRSAMDWLGLSEASYGEMANFSSADEEAIRAAAAR